MRDIDPYSRSFTAPENIRSHNGRTAESIAYFEHHEAFRIFNGRVVMDTAVGPYLQNKTLPVKNGRDNLNYVIGLPDIRTNLSTAYRYMIGSGNSKGDFFLTDSMGVGYYKEFQKQYRVPISVPKIWNYFSVGEILYYFHDNKYFTKIFEKKVTQFDLMGDILRDPAYQKSPGDIKLIWNNNSDQVFLTLHKNIYALEPQLNGDLVTKLLVEGFDADSVGIWQIYADKLTGKVFLGSLTNGLYVVSKKEFRTLTVAGGSVPNIFYAQLPFQTGTVLTPAGSVVGLQAATNQVIDKRLSVLEKADPADKRVILRDKNGTIWAESYEDLLHLDKDSKNIIGTWRLKSQITTMCQGKDGLIWIGAINYDLYSIDPDNPEKGLVKMSLQAPEIITFVESQDPRHLLVGTVSGLYRIDLVSKKQQLVEGSKDLTIKSINVHNRDQIWVTALGKGVMLIDGTGELTAFPIDKNKYLASPHCVVDDGNGYLWVPTNKGLFQMAIKDLLAYAALKKQLNKAKAAPGNHETLPSGLFYAYHTMEEGFNTNEFNGSCQPCGVKLSNGYISLPSLNGLVWFKPNEVNASVPGGNIVLDGANVNGLPLAVKGDSMRLPLDPENIRLNFTTAYLGNDYNLSLSYALVKGNAAAVNAAVEESSWIPIDNSDFTVRYSSLNPGDYTLLIRKKNGFGIHNEGVKKMYLTVPKRWYATNGAIVIFSFMFIISLLVVIYFWGRYQLLASARENKRLEEIIQKRTESLNRALLSVEDSKDEMEQQMHIFSRLVASISHDVQSPLRYIAFASQKIPQMVETNQLEKASKLGTTIFDLSDRMSNMLLDLLDFIKVTVYGKRVHFEDVSLKKLVDSKLELFKNLVDRNESYFVNDVPVAQTVFSDQRFLSIVIHNLIDNAAKYTYNGQVKIYMGAATDHEAELIISNTGRGIPLEMIEMINAPIEDKSLDDLMESGTVTGLGLLIVKEMGKLAGVTIKVTQTDVTSFHLLFGRES